MENPQSAHDASSERLPFEYQPLERPSMIRLIEVHSDRIDGLIDVSMRHFDLPQQPETSTDGPNYKCLSYTWGEPSEDHEILVNGKITHVRQNLFEFLELATESYPDEPLWVDALCISQGDHREKSHQVQRMGTIYQNATQVLVWLGKSLPDGSKWLQERLETNRKRTLGKGMLELVKNHSYACILQGIIDQPYWNRAWITQEILLQANIRILVGRGWISWTRLGRSIRFFNWRTLDRTKLVSDLHLTWSLIRSLYYSPCYQSGLFELLKLRSSSKCFDVRDRIYSLLAIASRPVGNGRLVVDYDEDAEGLFWRVCEIYRAWSSHKNITILMKALQLSIGELDVWLMQNAGSEIAISNSLAREWIQCWTNDPHFLSIYCRRVTEL
jgi:hypothetical protein